MKLYLQQHTDADACLTIGWLRTQMVTLIGSASCWISLEPRATLLAHDGQWRAGRAPGLAPLCRALPPDLDDLPLLQASLYAAQDWWHWHDAQPMSNLPLRRMHWSQTPSREAQEIEAVQESSGTVLPWQDRQRFGLSADPEFRGDLAVRHYYQSGKRITWRLLPNTEG